MEDVRLVLSGLWIALMLTYLLGDALPETSKLVR